MLDRGGGKERDIEIDIFNSTAHTFRKFELLDHQCFHLESLGFAHVFLGGNSFRSGSLQGVTWKMM